MFQTNFYSKKHAYRIYMKIDSSYQSSVQVYCSLQIKVLRLQHTESIHIKWATTIIVMLKYILQYETKFTYENVIFDDIRNE